MSDFAAWLLALVKKGFLAVWDLFTDLVIALLEALLSALAALLGALPVPSFISGGLTSILAQISPDIWFFASHFKFGQCFAVLGAAVAFRLARKAVTLFQW